MPNATVVLLALGLACGASPATEPSIVTADPTETATEGVSVSDEDDVPDSDEDDVSVSEEGDESDSRRCASDDDCVSGGPARCCTSSGPSCAIAWSRSAWEAFQASCAVRDCDRDIMLDCPDREGPPLTAGCVDGLCVLR